jgi:nitrite reductase/ring-hydroxylating ferredoxin subunit
MIGDSTTIRVAATATLPLGSARTFPLPDSDEQGFVIRTKGGLRAFRNRCRHWPAPLDMDDAEFWNPEAGMIMCKIHGALYRPDDGLCVYGPCSGAPLESFPLREDGDDCLVEVPTPR